MVLKPLFQIKSLKISLFQNKQKPFLKEYVSTKELNSYLTVISGIVLSVFFFLLQLQGPMLLRQEKILLACVNIYLISPIRLPNINYPMTSSSITVLKLIFKWNQHFL